jgi:anti-anti-sigma factor
VEGNSLAGEVAQKLKDSLNKLIDDGAKNFYLDLSSPQFIDSSGVGKLLFLNKKVLLEKGTFVIEKINPKLRDFFSSLALDSVMKIK